MNAAGVGEGKNEGVGSRTRAGFDLLVRNGRLHPKPLLLAICCGMVFGIFLVLSAAVLGRLTDDLILPAFEDGGVPRSRVWAGAGVFLAIAVVRTLAAVGRRWFGAMATRAIARTQRTRIAERYLRVPLSYHHSRSTGELLAHADTDIEVSTQITNMVPMSVGTITLIFVAAIQIALVDYLLLGVAFLVFPALAIANQLYTTRVHEPAALVQERLGSVSAMAHESFDGALVVKALGLEAAETKRMRAGSHSLREARLEVGRMRAVFEPGIEAIPNLGIVALLGVGAWRISSGNMTPGDLVGVAALFSVLTFPVRVFGFLLEELPRAQVADARLQAVLAVPDGPPEPTPPGTPLPDGALSLSFDHVSFSFAERPGGAPLNGNTGNPAPNVLDDVSFTVDPGEVVALVGPTGAGKSTISHLALRLDDAGSGTVRIGGVDVRTIAPASLREATAFVFQESFLFADSVAANITLAGATAGDLGEEAAPIGGLAAGPLDRDDAEAAPVAEAAHDQRNGGHLGSPVDGGGHRAAGRSAQADRVGLERAAETARAHRFITELPEGYDTVLGERGVTLSGGQRQRVALARALYREPRLVLLDDATSAVDAVIEAEILAGLRRNHDTTMLIVAHRLSTIELADRVVHLVDGKVRGIGTHTELLADPDYAALANAYRDEPVGERA